MNAQQTTKMDKPDSTLKYPLDIENVGEDVYILRSKGHHDVHEFMRAVRELGYNWPLGMPQHLWCKTVPSRKDDYNCFYHIVPEGTRGAYPVTYAQEAWNADAYEAIVASSADVGVQS